MTELHGTCDAFLALPPELIFHVLSFLEPCDLAQVAQTNRKLRDQSYDNQIWSLLVNQNLHAPINNPAPCHTFRELYLTHHPHWFLPRHRIWFSDSEPSGKLIVSRYDARRGCIEAYAVVAARGRHTLDFWEKDKEVIIHSFNPRVSLDLNQPVVKLDIGGHKTDDQPHTYPSDRGYAPSSVYSKETLMEIFAEDRLYGSFMLCRALPDAAVGQGTSVWPPLRFPAAARVRNATRDNFQSVGHRPSKMSEVSQYHFRLRKWVEYSGRRSNSSVMSFTSPNGLSATLGMGGPYFSRTFNPVGGGGMSIRMPEDITTYATIPESRYLPTKEKPWQGIWCGDYSGHGCEFLVILQPDKQDEQPLPDGMGWLARWFKGGRKGSGSSASSYASAQEAIDYDEATRVQASDDDNGGDDAEFDDGWVMPGPVDPPPSSTIDDDVSDHVGTPTGRLEAIKLTGDPNIPRGEYTFIAPDIGPGGFMRVCDEEKFRGARVVRSAGHIASRGFVDDEYTPSQLIMISHDRLAQFWEGYGHISFYQRVDLDALMKVGF